MIASHCLRLPGTRDDDGLPPPGRGLHQHEQAPRAVAAACLSRGSVAASCSEVSSSRKAVAADEKKSGKASRTVQPAITMPWSSIFRRKYGFTRAHAQQTRRVRLREPAC